MIRAKKGPRRLLAQGIGLTAPLVESVRNARGLRRFAVVGGHFVILAGVLS